MPTYAAIAVVVIACVLVLWTVVVAVAAAKVWQLLEKMNAKLDSIATDMRILSQKGEQLLGELHKLSSSARNQMDTMGTIVRDVRGWVDKAETTAEFVRSTVRDGVTSSFTNARAFFHGMLGFLQFFVRRPEGGATAQEVSNEKEN
ncbi:MAG: hypothetical protein NTY01_07335 [Verrucomicrobia bacterium]|nr:hypothetical protein [Verrucomicrobiota bacterium]